ncbi:MAG: hypothetical protein GX444_18820 [Myxococcales bacterium]|nr:hypothetical protein [Myxococcales bacterium]
MVIGAPDKSNTILTPDRPCSWKSADGRRLFGLGFATLFLELALIRYLAGNIWNLGYFPNLVLMAVFLGMGLGFLFHPYISERRSPLLLHGAQFLLLVLVLYVYVARPIVPLADLNEKSLHDEFFFLASVKKTDQVNYLPFLFCFVACIGVFALISQRTAKYFRLFRPLTAYTLDILGSCAGIVTFMAFSFFTLPPTVWFAAFAALLLAAAADSWKTRWLAAAIGELVVLTAQWQSAQHLARPAYHGGLEVVWSPYQRLEYIDDPSLPEVMRRSIWVNGRGHQRIGDRAGLAQSVYRFPYRDRAQDPTLPPFGDVLVLGAGSGNDTAVALLNGAQHVDAVEIDPVIARFGRRYHPLRPYQDPRVDLIVDDGRAWMTRAPRRYDLIVFAYADSLVRVSSLSQLRLENYLFTRESFQRAYELLGDNGCVYVFNSFPNPWLGEKIRAMIQAASGRTPQVVFQEDREFLLFKFGRAPSCNAEPAALAPVEYPTDDWPFLHLRQRGIPAFYLKALGGLTLLVVLLIGTVRLLGRRRGGAAPAATLRLELAFLFMGLAFLLLETKSVIQFSLLFGATWVNNSLVFLAALGLVLAANWTAQWFGDRLRQGRVFVLLLLSCFLPLVFPLRNLLYVGNGALRFALAGLLTFLPLYFANLIFSLNFRDQAAPEHLFGWNLIGATLGGMLEYASLVLGYNGLALVVAVCYALVFVLLRAAPAGERAGG